MEYRTAPKSYRCLEVNHSYCPSFVKVKNLTFDFHSSKLSALSIMPLGILEPPYLSFFKKTTPFLTYALLFESIRVI